MAKINKEDCTKIACVCYDSRAGVLVQGYDLIVINDNALLVDFRVHSLIFR